MICRKCGAEISDNSIRCKNCGIKVNMYCPSCQTLNRFGEKYCVNCGFELLLSCNVCSATNIYYADNCRKCHSALTKDIKQTPQNLNDFQVVESFSSDEANYATKEVSSPIKVINDLEENGLPVIDKTQPSYCENNIENIFNADVENKSQQNTEEEIILNKSQEFDNSLGFDDLLLVEENNEEINSPDLEQNELPQSDNFDDNDILNEFESVDVLECETLLENEDKEENIQNENSQIEEEKINTQSDNDIEQDSENNVLLDEDEQIENEKSIDNSEEVKNFGNELEEDVDSIFRLEVQPEAVVKISNIIKNSLQKHIIAVTGPEGSGKSAILKQTSEYLVEKGYLSLYGSCNQLVKITSFGFFQDVFLRLMGFPPYTTDAKTFMIDFKKSSFSKAFSFLSEKELRIFLNILYPSLKDVFDNIIVNKMKIFSILEKIIKSFLKNNNVLILIDNFELLDGASYDFIVYMMQQGFFNNRVKLLVASIGNKDIKNCFELSSEEEKLFETINIEKLNKQELLERVERTALIRLENVLREEEINELVIKSDGNAIRMEQEIALLIDTGYLEIKDGRVIVNPQNKPSNSPKTFEELIKQRINVNSPSIKNVLFMAAIMGYRFAIEILKQAVSMPEGQAEQTIKFLIQNNFIQNVDSYTCEFKSLTIWELIYKEAKEDLFYKENAKKLYNTLKPLTLSSNLLQLISCEEALSGLEEFNIWNKTANLTARLGDTNLYVIVIKKCLELMGKNDIPDSEKIKQIKYEEMGKLLCEKSPNEAFKCLSTVLYSYIKEADIKKIIDISSYFVKSCYLTGRFLGVVEAVDEVLKSLKVPEINASALDIALIKTRKLNALLNIGNCEQIINIAEEEIIPEIDKNIENNQIDNDYKNIILNAWFNTKIILAKAYAIQGNSKVNKVISDINGAIDKYNYNSEYYRLNARIIEALGKTIEGDIHKSNEILNNISIEYQTKVMEPSLLAWWNLVNIANRILTKQFENLKNDLYELGVFSNNINEHFIKNIVKLILGFILKQEGDLKKAEEIYNEQIEYFAKEKIAIGALLTWALMVRKYIDDGDVDKAQENAVRSLAIAQSPKINNYLFTIYFQKLLAEIYLDKGDFAAVKMYLEKSIVIAKQFNLKYQLIGLYIDYAKYMQAMMKSMKIYSTVNVTVVNDAYQKAVLLAKETAIQSIIESALKEYSGFKTFCQLNSIEL